MLTKIEKIFDNQIRPALAQHGGNVEIVDFNNGVLSIRFFGGCHGCSGSQITLKDGIEQVIKHHFPEISEIVDLTDHTSGTNPYL